MNYLNQITLTRDLVQKCKGEIAQYISQIIKEQCDAKKSGRDIDKEFMIPDYLKEAVYCVTKR